MSTQSITAVAIDIDTGNKVYEHQLKYLEDWRLNRFGINDDFILPPSVEGEANQPPLMFAAALDAMLDDMRQSSDINLGEVAAINVSAQQHGHVYLNNSHINTFYSLNHGANRKSPHGLEDILAGVFAFPAPIWKTSASKPQADRIREFIGGQQEIIELSGSDAPARFTGPVIRWMMQTHPEVYRNTSTIQLLSGLVTGIFIGTPKAPIGDGAGTLLMDYSTKTWSRRLVDATTHGLEFSAHSLEYKLPRIQAPDSFAGNIAKYFVEKYGFSPECKVLVGSGDNPQSKVVVPADSDLLSLGTSFVYMVPPEKGRRLDLKGYGNSMHDGHGNEFLFYCRTNGAGMINKLMGNVGWDEANQSLGGISLNDGIFIWQPQDESLPPSKSFNAFRDGYESPDLARDLNGAINSSLAAIHLYAGGFQKTDKPLYVTGGMAKSEQVLRRVAAFANRTVEPIESGAALGAALVGARAYLKKEKISTEHLDRVFSIGNSFTPLQTDVRDIPASGLFLSRFQREYTKLIGG